MWKRTQGWVALALIVSFAVLAAVSAWAADNDGLDTTFGGFGSGGVVVQSPLEINDLALQPDGKIVAAGVRDGRFAAARFLANGALDQGFGAQGLVVIPIADLPGSSAANGVVVQRDGKIVLAGTASGSDGSDMAVIRLMASGAPDASFGADGQALVDFDGGDDSAEAIVIDGDGRLVVGGSAQIDGGYKFAAVALTPSGAPDASFGGDGMASVGFGDDAFALDLLVQPGGEVVLAGRASVATLDTPGSIHFAVARLHGDGTPDPGFGDDGKLSTGITDQDFGSSVALQPDGKIVVAGSGAESTFVLASYNPDGSPDVSLDGDGRLSTPFGGAATAVSSVAALPDGTIIVAGQAENAMAFVRYNLDGTLNTWFDGDGKLLLKPSPLVGAAAQSLVRAPDGRLLAAGGPLLARLFPDGSIDAGGRQVSAPGPESTRSFRVPYATLAQPDGKIVSIGLVGYAIGEAEFSVDVALVRHTPDGQLDPTFGRNGEQLIGLPEPYEFGYDGVIQSDGKIVVAGVSRPDPKNGEDLLLARVQPDGSPDRSCGTDGLVSIDLFGGLRDDVQRVTLQADGKILVAGISSDIKAQMAQAFMARFDANCELDKTFGDGGRLQVGIGSSVANLFALPDGNVLLAGSEQSSAFLARYNANGMPDMDFGKEGKVVTPLGLNGSATAAATLPNGKTLVAGYRIKEGVYLSVLLRYAVDGSLDPAFGTNGTVAIGLGDNGVPFAIALRGDGAIGLVWCGEERESAPVALFNPNGTPNTAFSDDGETDLTAGGYTCLTDAVFSGGRLVAGGYASSGQYSFVLAAYPTDGQREVGFAPAPAMVAETGGAVTLTVALSQTAAQTVTVHYTASGGTATNGADYVLAAGTLTFAPGQTSQRISVPIHDDPDDEPDETVSIGLSSPSNAILGSGASVTLRIADDDTPTRPAQRQVFLPLTTR